MGGDLPESPLAVQQGIHTYQMDHHRQLVAIHQGFVLECFHTHGDSRRTSQKYSWMYLVYRTVVFQL